MMRAAWYERTGPARDVITLGDMPVPDPGPGEVRVQIRASGINPSDTKKRAGWLGASMTAPRIIPHSDGAGVIEAVGADVNPGRVGERVWVYKAQRGRAFGTAAEFVALPASQAVRLPDGASFADGACFGVPAQTAHNAVFADGLVRGQTVLVAGAAGAVGHYAVQFAAWSGARVITTVSSDQKADHARAGGADDVINYRLEDVAQKVMALTGGAGVDRIIEVDFGANLAIDCAIIKPNGVIASYSSTAVPEPVLPYYTLAHKGVTVRLVQLYLLPEPAHEAACRDISTLIEEGKLINTIGQRFSLTDTALAHEAVESGDIMGNVVIEIGAP